MTDSGYGSQSQRSASPRLEVDGLTHWKEKPVTTDLWNRFQDVRSRLQLPLVTYLRKKKRPINVTFKLSALGPDLDSAVFWIIILCHEKSYKKAKSFIGDKQGRRFVRGNSPGQVALGIKVVPCPLISTASDDTISVSGASFEELDCAFVRFQLNDKISHGTLGGNVRTVDTDDHVHVYGLTSNHIFQYGTAFHDPATAESDSNLDSVSNDSDADTQSSISGGSENETGHVEDLFVPDENELQMIDRDPLQGFDPLAGVFYPKREFSPRETRGDGKRRRFSNDDTADSTESDTDSEIDQKRQHGTANDSTKPELLMSHIEVQATVGIEIVESISLVGSSRAMLPGNPFVSHAYDEVLQKNGNKAPEMKRAQLGTVSTLLLTCTKARNRDWALIDYSDRPQQHPGIREPPWKDYDETSLALEPTTAALDIILLQPDVLYSGRLSRVPAFSVLPFGEEIIMTYLVSFHDTALLPDGLSGSWIVRDSGQCIEVYGQIVARDTFNDFYMVPIVDILSDIKATLSIENVTIPGHVKCFNYQTLGELLGIMGPRMSISTMRRRLDLTSFVAEFRACMPPQVARIVAELGKSEESSIEMLKRRLLQIQEKQAARKTLRNMRRLLGFLQSLEDLAQLKEVIPFEKATYKDAITLISASAAFVFMTAADTSLDAMEVLIEAYLDIGHNVPSLERAATDVVRHPYLSEVIRHVCMDVLDFHQHAVRLVSPKGWERTIRCMWKDFHPQFLSILANLREACIIFQGCDNGTTYESYIQARLISEQRHQDQIAIEHRKRMDNVKAWLSANKQSEKDHQEHQITRIHYPGTAVWILEHELMRKWLDFDINSTPILLMSGPPGAGKTIIASAVIDKLKELPGSTAFFHCHFQDPRSDSAIAVLTGIIEQLFSQNPESLPICWSRRTMSGEITLRSLSVAMKLLEDLCGFLPRVNLVIDGLNECDSGERREILEVMKQLVLHCDRLDQGKLQVLLISQDSPDIHRSLNRTASPTPLARTLFISEKDVEGDIETYVRVWVVKIAEKHGPFSNEMVEYLQNLTLKNAKGMFLHARFVLENLHAQLTRDDLLQEIHNNRSLKGIDDVFEQILTSLRGRYSLGDLKIQRKLLGWLFCAKRRFTWREMQCGLSIDTEDQIIDYDDGHLRVHISELLGPLIHEDEGRISLVHNSARNYLAAAMYIDIPSVECDLATLFLSYLTFPCFNTDIPADSHELKELSLEGQLALQDYAVANCFEHVIAVVDNAPQLLESLDEDLHERLQSFTVALDDFMLRYDEVDWDKEVSEECRQKCRPFKEYPMHERLMLLMNYIMTPPQLGTGWNVAMSIPSLKIALQRNREMLESIDPESEADQADVAEYNKFYDLSRRFKCPVVTCDYFSIGFKDKERICRHQNLHDRAYQCSVRDCPGQHAGYANVRELRDHQRKIHPEESDLAEAFKRTRTNSNTRNEVFRDDEWAVILERENEGLGYESDGRDSVWSRRTYETSNTMYSQLSSSSKPR